MSNFPFSIQLEFCILDYGGVLEPGASGNRATLAHMQAYLVTIWTPISLMCLLLDMCYWDSSFWNCDNYLVTMMCNFLVAEVITCLKL